MRDPLLQIGYWLPDSNRYVDLDGRAFDVPPAGALASTVVEHGGQPIAVLVHGASLLDDPDLIRAACAAGGLALANARLQAELRARVNELRQSQARGSSRSGVRSGDGWNATFTMAPSSGCCR